MLLVAGSANLDFVVRANHIPQPGETVLGRDFMTFPGGKGANQAVACSRAGGAATHMLLALGQDTYATPLERSLSDAGVVLHTVRMQHQPTGCAFICVSDGAENAITVAPGANLCLTSGHLPPLAGFTHLLMQLEIPLASVTAYAIAARSQGITVALNAAPAQVLPQDLLDVIDILVVNEGELATVSGHNGTICQMLAGINVPTVVVTLGHMGCCARHLNQYHLQAAFPIQAVDTTAAGDTFCGSLIAALSQDKVMASALRQASAAGALTCTQLGAQSSIPTAQQVDEFLATRPEPSPDKLDALRRHCGLI